jgi:hypothetical protein
VHPTEEVHPTASSIIELAIKAESNVDQFEIGKMFFKKMGLKRQTQKNPFHNSGKGTEYISVLKPLLNPKRGEWK